MMERTHTIPLTAGEWTVIASCLWHGALEAVVQSKRQEAGFLITLADLIEQTICTELECRTGHPQDVVEVRNEIRQRLSLLNSQPVPKES